MASSSLIQRNRAGTGKLKVKVNAYHDFSEDSCNGYEIITSETGNSLQEACNDFSEGSSNDNEIVKSETGNSSHQACKNFSEGSGNDNQIVKSETGNSSHQACKDFSEGSQVIIYKFLHQFSVQTVVR